MAQADTTQPSGIVTPEAVVLQFETANVGSRILAALIDVMIQGTLMIVLFFVLSTVIVAGFPGWVAFSLYLIASFLVLFVYPTAFETLWRGRTPGKAALGLRVVTVEGAPVRFRHAAIRAALAIVELYTLGFIAVIMILLSNRNQRLGDLVAGTIVLRERSGAGDPQAVMFPMPYGMDGYVATLDVSGISGPDYTAIRSFLLRAGSLPPPVRFDLARQMATPLAARLRHAPPSQVGPELFLACLAVAYQRRALATSPTPVAQPGWGQPAPYGWPGPALTAPAAPTGYGSGAPAPAAYGATPPPSAGPAAPTGSGEASSWAPPDASSFAPPS